MHLGRKVLVGSLLITARRVSIEGDRERTKELYAFLTTDTTLSANNLLRFRKNLFLMKMTVTDQIKTLDRKFKQNEAQYDLDKKAAKISALYSGNLNKYEYLTGEDLNYQSSTGEQAKFDYSPLNEFFSRRLQEEDKKEGLLKRLKHIENKTEDKQSKQLGIKSVIDIFDEQLTQEARDMLINLGN